MQGMMEVNCLFNSISGSHKFAAMNDGFDLALFLGKQVNRSLIEEVQNMSAD